MPASPRLANAELDALVSAARAGDHRAWSRLVAQFDRMLRSVARSYRLPPQDVDDVVQATWVKLYEHLDRLRDTSAIAGWLATTVRRESLRVLQRGVRELLTDSPGPAGGARQNGPEDALLHAERRLVLTRAFATLPERQRRLMELIAAGDAVTYEQISAALGMPVGSIGPSRARSLARLELHDELREYARAA
jgi:RNA polymerase sigma factor (sigma-70 family)